MRSNSIINRATSTAMCALVAAALGGCAHDPFANRLAGDNFGEANRQTFAAQVIDPDPQYETLVPETSADHAAQAAERYRKDQVKQPDQVRTSDLSTGDR